MTAIQVRTFMGEVPLVAPQLLPDGMAVTSRNTKLNRGSLDAWKGPLPVTTLTKTGTLKTIYRFGQDSATDAQYWFSWTTDVNVVRTPISGDTTERTYFTGDGYPKKTDATLALTGGTNYPVNAYQLGVPMPVPTGASVTVSGTAAEATSAVLTGAYVITYVTSWSEESAPCAAAIGTFTFQNGQALTLNNLPTAPAGNYNVSTKRIYRSNTGTSGSAYQFVAEIPVANTTYVDTKLVDQLGETLATDGWYEPPQNGFGLTLGANGNAIMLAGKTIYPCVPFVLYAYPEAYQLSTETDIVGAGAFGQGFVILTKANPYVVTGVDPSGYSMERMSDNQACVSKRSIVEMMGGVVYASPDGLWAIDSSGMRSLSQKVMSKEDWQAIKPESIHAHELDGRYYAYYDTGVVQGCLIFDFGRVPYVIRLNQYCTAAYNDPIRDSMYTIVGQQVSKWDAGSTLTYLWRSKDYRYPWFTSFAYAKVDAQAYPVTFRLYYDGVLAHTQSVTSHAPFRLPAKTGLVVAFEAEGTNTVDGIALASAGEEINKL